jgi:hypothetical protein
MLPPLAVPALEPPSLVLPLLLLLLPATALALPALELLPDAPLVEPAAPLLGKVVPESEQPMSKAPRHTK